MNYNTVYKLLRAYRIPKPKVVSYLNGAHDGIAQTILLDQQQFILTWNKVDGFTLNPVQQI